MTGRIVHGDCVEVMAAMESESVAVIVTSPPYNLKIPVGRWDTRTSAWRSAKLQGGYQGFDDAMADDDYVAWQRACLTEMLRLLKPGGALFYNHTWKTKNGVLNDRSDIMAGFDVRQVIIWARPGGIDFGKSYFCPTYEVIYLLTKGKFRLVPGATGHGTVWQINPYATSDRNKHPASFPVELPYRAIGSVACPGPVLDPFLGSGTTAVAATRLGRDWVGIEQSAEYIAMAEDRVAVEEATVPLFR